jgi:hypothetical protein
MITHPSQRQELAEGQETAEFRIRPTYEHEAAELSQLALQKGMRQKNCEN